MDFKPVDMAIFPACAKPANTNKAKAWKSLIRAVILIMNSFSGMPTCN